MAAAHTDRLEAPLATHSRPRGPAEAYPLLDPTLALEIVLGHTRVLESESISAAEADGRVLAADVVSDEDFPAGPRSSVDGYAVRSADAEPRRQLIGEVTAGHPS